MTELDTLFDAPPSPEEASAARGLAEALESGVSEGADPSALAVARLLQGLSAKVPAEESAAARTRAELVALAARPSSSEDETGVTPGEAESARRLAGALESGAPEGLDPGALAATRLLQSLGGDAAGEDFARRKTRADLLARASRTRRRRASARFAAAAALAGMALTGALLWRSTGSPSDQLLASREADARAALAALSYPGAETGAQVNLRERMDDMRAERFASSLRSVRMEALLGQSGETRTAEKDRATGKAPAGAHETGGAL